MSDGSSASKLKAIHLPALQGSVTDRKGGVALAPQFVDDHFHEKFPASAIASHCGLSRFQFSRSFHAAYGITFREYLLRYRVRAACDRLLQADLPVTEIAYAVGFHDGSYFARMFRRYTGVLPSQYARAHAASQGSRQR